MMPGQISDHLRFGAASLAVSAVLLAVFPLARPHFRLDPRQPEVTIVAAGPAVASVPWVVAHTGLMIAFVLLLVSLPMLYAHLASTDAEPRAWRAMLLSLTGIALVLPAVGVEAFALPGIGRLYLEGRDQIAPMIDFIYRGPMTLVLLVGLMLLAVGSFMFASAMRRTGTFSRWPGVLLAAGLTLWLPLLPPAIRIADGLLIGVGGVWLASSMWRASGAPRRPA